MHYTNEYEMTKDRFVKWTTPIFYRLPVFYIYCVVFVISGFAWYYFEQNDAPMKWITLACFMMLISLYRGVLYRPLSADKQYRIMKQQQYNDKPWTCKMDIDDHGIKVSTNGKKTGYSAWDRVISFEEAKSYFDLVIDNGEQIRLDKGSFTEGDADSFKSYMNSRHNDIPYKEVAPKANR